MRPDPGGPAGLCMSIVIMSCEYCPTTLGQYVLCVRAMRAIIQADLGSDFFGFAHVHTHTQRTATYRNCTNRDHMRPTHGSGGATASRHAQATAAGDRRHANRNTLSCDGTARSNAYKAHDKYRKCTNRNLHLAGGSTRGRAAAPTPTRQRQRQRSARFSQITILVFKKVIQESNTLNYMGSSPGC